MVGFSDCVRAAEIYRDDDLAVRARTGFSDKVCFVTFDSYTYQHGLDRKGFGEEFFASRKIDAVHIVPSGNSWYQYPGFPRACARIAGMTSAYSRVISYGSSMGGYAAIRYGGWVRAHEAFAVSPQFSASPFRWPFELRWLRDMFGRRILHESAAQPVPLTTLAYDPSEWKDVLHVALFRRLTNVVDFRVPDSGHPATGFLSELGLLQRSLLAIADGEFVARDFEAEAMRRRGESSQYHMVLAKREKSKKKAIVHAEKATEIGPAFAPAWETLALMATRRREFDRAIAAIERARALEPDVPRFRMAQAYILERSGNINEALSRTRELFSIHPSHGRRLKILLAKQAISEAFNRPSKTGTGI